MSRLVRTLATVAVGATLALASPLPCTCAGCLAALASPPAHSCCAPASGISATADGCCTDAPDPAELLRTAGFDTLLSVSPSSAILPSTPAPTWPARSMRVATHASVTTVLRL